MKLHTLLLLLASASATEIDGSAMLQTRNINMASSKVVPYGFTLTTKEGCKCKKRWKHQNLNGRVVRCRSACCNPTNDKADWCYVQKGDPCGKEWGYCAVPAKQVPVKPPRKTKEGCICQRSWKVDGKEPCNSYCCNPDKSESDWCITEIGGSCNVSWGFCAAVGQRSAAACKRWCKKNKQPWGIKCNWNGDCDGCEDCTKPSTGPVCKPWCANHKQPWDVKCKWTGRCEGCKDCTTPSAPAPSAPAPPAQSAPAPSTPSTSLMCKPYCAKKNKAPWHVKCKWKTGHCAGCPQCSH